MVKHTEIPELMTLKEEREILKVHPNTLRSWDKQGVLPVVRIGIKKIRKYMIKNIIVFAIYLLTFLFLGLFTQNTVSAAYDFNW